MAQNTVNPPTSEQIQAWGFYGTPKSTSGQASTVVAKQNIGKQVGEVRYIIGWMADQMVRMGWRLVIDGSESWTLKLPDGGETVTSDAAEEDTEAATHPSNASRRILASIEWNARTVREVTTNLFVAGELHYALDGNRWRVVSVIRSDREAILKRSAPVVHGLWPHPADPTTADAPIFGVLGTLDDMAWLNRLSRSQSANRVGMRGILGVADTFTTADGATGTAFWDQFEASLSRPMEDPEDTSPVGLVGAQGLVEPSGNGMKGLSWVIPDFPYDDRVDERMEKLIHRLAYGLPVPPEVLLGMQAQSKATAFQVEGSTYRAHIEPVAMLVADIATDALGLFLPDGVGEISVVPDPTVILARRHSVSDAFDAFDRGAISYAYLREVIGFPKRAEVTEEDIAIRVAWQARANAAAAPPDPANVAAEDIAIAAAASAPTEQDETAPQQPESADDAWLSDVLHRLDMQALYELMGAFPQAVTKARERLGARVRTDRKLQAQLPKEMPNDELPLHLGAAEFRALGIDPDALIKDAIQSTLDWWQRRIEETRVAATHYLDQGEVPLSYELTPAASVEMLETLLTESVFTEAAPQEARFRDIVDLAGR